MHKLDVLNISEAHKDEKKYSLSRFHQFFSNMMVSETQDRIAKKTDVCYQPTSSKVILIKNT